MLLEVLVAPAASLRQRDTDRAPSWCPQLGTLHPPQLILKPFLPFPRRHLSMEALTGSTAPSPHPPERLRLGEGTSRTGYVFMGMGGKIPKC